MNYDGPVVLAILDGVGLAPDSPGNAVARARTPFLARAVRDYLHVALDASGEAVGLMSGQVGNSEIGHNTMGSGQIVKQDLLRVNEAFKDGSVYKSEAWQGAIKQIFNSVLNGKADATLHFAGIFSDGGVHSHIEHLEQMIERAYREGVRRMRVHAIFDGRDTPPQSEPKYILRFEEFVKKFPDADIKIASGGGRQTTVADRYENDWQVVKRGFDMMVEGKAENYFNRPEEAINVLRVMNPEVQDQDLPAFVIVDNDKKPVGLVKKGDALIYFDFRKDRAIEITQAFVEPDFDKFSRGNFRPSDVYFVGMTEYNSDTHVPEHRLVEPVAFRETLHEFLSAHGVSQLAVSETVKFGHVTYYFDGNSYDKLPGEEFVEVDSFKDYPANRPWMKSAEIADVVIENLEKYQFVRVNFPNGDVVGHTADIEATTIAMEAVDLVLARMAKRVDELGGMMIIVADHGNAEELIDTEGAPKTAHTLNKVPCIFYDNTMNRGEYILNDVVLRPGLSNLASTVAVLMGLNDYLDVWDAPLVKWES